MERRPQHWKLHVHPHDPQAAAYVRSDGEVRWNLTDVEVVTVEELHPEGSMDVQNLQSLGMGWAWCVNDYPNAETLADMTPMKGTTSPKIALTPENLDLEGAGLLGLLAYFAVLDDTVI